MSEQSDLEDHSSDDDDVSKSYATASKVSDLEKRLTDAEAEIVSLKPPLPAPKHPQV